MRRRRGKQNEMEAMASLVRKVYPASEPDEARAMRLFGAFNKVVSARIRDNARPVFYRAGLMTVHTATSAWANALTFESAQIIAKLRARLPEIPLQRIAFRVGRLPELPEQVQPQKPPPRLLPIAQLPDALARELALIRNDGLRESVARAAVVSLSEPARDKERDRGPGGL